MEGCNKKQKGGIKIKEIKAKERSIGKKRKWEITENVSKKWNEMDRQVYHKQQVHEIDRNIKEGPKQRIR